MNFISSFLNLAYHILPPQLMDRLGNSSLPSSDRAYRIFSRIDSSVFEYYSKKKLIYMFKRSASLVPAYSQFLSKENIDPRNIRNAEDFIAKLPSTGKENYIRAYPIAERCIRGTIPRLAAVEESSGTSGIPTIWIRSKEEENYSISLTNASLKYLYGFREEHNYISLNCFMLGGWSGGMRFAARAGQLSTIRNIGPDPEKVVSFMIEMGAGFTYLVAGYPPFITELIEYGRRREGFDWKNFHVNIFAGGEGFPEEWREYVVSSLREGSLVYSDYGAIDLDAGISLETPFSVAIRKLIKTNPRLRADLLSTERLPVFIGQYSNQQYFINQAVGAEGEKEIEVTVMNLKSVSPGIKYAIHDEGGIAKFRDVCSILEQHGYSTRRLKEEFNIKALIPFPFIWLYGRSDGTVSVNGAMISPEEIQRCILSQSELISAINTFKLSVQPDDNNYIRLFLYLEARKEVNLTESAADKFTDSIVSCLSRTNECFRLSYEKNPSVNRPVIRIYPHGSGVFDGKKTSLKNIYKL